uniref:Uncharacterized protein n=1 Tax=Romanomermis culicivorax TaxID=13658 RepID=A0A915IDV3_ROMCU
MSSTVFGRLKNSDYCKSSVQLEAYVCVGDMGLMPASNKPLPSELVFNLHKFYSGTSAFFINHRSVDYKLEDKRERRKISFH